MTEEMAEQMIAVLTDINGTLSDIGLVLTLIFIFFFAVFLIYGVSKLL